MFIFDFYLAEDPFTENDMSPLSTVENLYSYKRRFFELDWQGSFEKTQWLELLRPFTAVKNLCVSKEYAPRLMLALQEIVGCIRTKVVPTSAD